MAIRQVIKVTMPMKERLMQTDIGELVEDICGIKILSMEKVFSRRNEVYLLQGLNAGDKRVKYVLKLNRRASVAPEVSILKQLSAAGLRVPSVVWSDEHTILMEYSAGILLADMMYREELIRQNDWVEALTAWLYQLHTVRPQGEQGLCFPDLNLRNFIFTGSDIVGLDFEATVWDRPERDLGGLSAFIINSDPMFTAAKYDAIRRLVNSYARRRPIDLEKVREYFILEMRSAAQRRVNQQEILLAKIRDWQDMSLFN